MKDISIPEQTTAAQLHASQAGTPTWQCARGVLWYGHTSAMHLHVRSGMWVLYARDPPQDRELPARLTCSCPGHASLGQRGLPRSHADATVQPRPVTGRCQGQGQGHVAAT